MARTSFHNQHFRDLDEVIRLGLPANPKFLKTVADQVIGGQRIGATRMRMRSPAKSETHYEKKFEELILVGHAFTLAGVHAELHSSEITGMPDFVGLADGQPVGVEAANVTASAHVERGIAKLRHILKPVVAAPHRYVALSLPLCPLPQKLDSKCVLEEACMRLKRRCAAGWRLHRYFVLRTGCL